MARYGQAFRDRIVARLLPPESTAIDVVSREVGVSVATLERWRAQALAAPGELANNQRWTPAARLEAVITTATVDVAARSAWCREQGLYPAELEAWKHDAIAGLGEPRAASAVEARQDRRRVKELERELHRKDKALAETAALLVLRKTHGPPRLQGDFATWPDQSTPTYPASETGSQPKWRSAHAGSVTSFAPWRDRGQAGARHGGD